MNKAKTILEAPEVGESSSVAMPPDLRRLKWNELVSRGDFVENGRQGYEPWEGPGGFRADAFVKAIYRKRGRRPAGTE
jgi:hypothetical protein